MSLPSKLTSYFFANKPILAAIPKGGATWNFLGDNAEIVESSNPRALAEAMITLSKDDLRRAYLAFKAHQFAKENLTQKIGHEKYLAWINGFWK